MDSIDDVFEERLSRLEALQGTDPGFFTLAVHSFIEGTLREKYSSADLQVGFAELINSFIQDYIITTSNKKPPEVNTLALVKQAHYETNEVRHRFFPSPVESAQVATQQLDCFCRMYGIEAHDRLRTIKQYLAVWNQREPLGCLFLELQRLQTLYSYEAQQKRELVEQVAELSQLKSTVFELTTHIRAKESQIMKLEKVKETRNSKIDELRSERAVEREKLSEAKKRITELEKAQFYIDTVRRMTVFTRSRADYERMIIRLTPEQETVLDQINLNADFLVKGNAGTGKTLVLLKAIEKLRGGGKQHTLGMQEFNASVALLTYTTTLVKYDRYLSTILDSGTGANVITTVDSFLLDRLREIAPQTTIDQEILQRLCVQHSVKGFSAEEIAAEIENFIWGNNVNYDEYCVQGIPRKGMRKPMRLPERKAIWTVMLQIIAHMEAEQAFPFRYVAVKLLKLVETVPSEKITRFDYIFIDEAQDLAPISLMVLKKLANTCVLLAGDADQSIYQPGFSYIRGGLDITGRSRILKTNFRNTVQIHELAELFRKKTSGPDDLDNTPHAFRDGPMPELFQSKNLENLLQLVLDRIDFFTKILGYDPENICILTPSSNDFASIIKKLEAENYTLAKIKDKDFEFDQSDSLRISTLHSSKGLDFPVVLLCLPHEPKTRENYDDETNEQLQRNLLYVAMTRAMDHLNVFTPESPTGPAIADLVDCFLKTCTGDL